MRCSSSHSQALKSYHQPGTKGELLYYKVGQGRRGWDSVSRVQDGLVISLRLGIVFAVAGKIENFDDMNVYDQVQFLCISNLCSTSQTCQWAEGELGFKHNDHHDSDGDDIDGRGCWLSGMNVVVVEVHSAARNCCDSGGIEMGISFKSRHSK